VTDDNVTESWACIVCGVNTAPGIPPGPLLRDTLKRDGKCPTVIGNDSEVYMVRKAVWAKAGMEPWSGCLCIGCLERLLGRRLRPKDFDRSSAFESEAEIYCRGTPRLLDRRGVRGPAHARWKDWR
jgi:hypothetical protein